MIENITIIIIERPWLFTLLSVAVLIATAFFANFVVKRILLRLLGHLFSRTALGRDKELGSFSVIARLANLMPALVIYLGIDLVPHVPDAIVTIVKNVANAFMILTVVMAIAAALDVADTLYHRRPDSKLKPIKSYLQILKIAAFAIAAILMIAALMDRSPLILLSGLGAMAAVLILVFQDTLLSLVAGIQISSTDMVRVGDWIEMPALNADGDVIEIALHTVRVQNWDKTITTIPIRKLVTESFKNWRGMQQSGGRRIKRSLYIDQSTVRFLKPQEIKKLSRFVLLKSYLADKQDEISQWNEQLGDDGSIGANTRRITNIGTFRAYVDAYLRQHMQIHQNMTLLVRQLQPGPEGLPLEIYCFTNTVAWASYETIQSDIFDHLLAVMPEFGLSIFQSPSGNDVKSWMPARAEA